MVYTQIKGFDKMLTFFHLNNDQACKSIKLQISEYKKIIKYYSAVKIKAYLITLISYDKNRTHFSINQKIHRLELVFLLFQFGNHQTSFHIPFRLFLKRQHRGNIDNFFSLHFFCILWKRDELWKCGFTFSKFRQGHLGRVIAHARFGTRIHQRNPAVNRTSHKAKN